MQQTVVNGRYRTLGPLGSGGMAEVHLARDDVLERDVALKFMSGRLAGDEESVRRFEREARSAAALSHPNIVPVHDYGRTQEGVRYIVMEHLPGGTLAEQVARRGGKLAPRTAVEVAMEIAEALEEAHERGVVHRDVKPQNVLVTAKGDVKVADFGIAGAAASPATDGTDPTGSFLGTVHYASPEQVSGEPATPRSDLYSLGVVLYEMLTGELPFDAESPVAVSLMHVNEPPRPPKGLDPDVPEAANAVVVKLLAKDPADRHGSAAALLADLERARDGLAAAAGAEGAEGRAAPPAHQGSGGEAGRSGEGMGGRASGAGGAPGHNPGLAAVLSALVPGLGQVYNGQITKGLVVLVVQLLNFALTGILIGWVPLAIVWVWGVSDARRTAEGIKAGGRPGRWRRRMVPWLVAAVCAALAALFATGWSPFQGP